MLVSTVPDSSLLVHPMNAPFVFSCSVLKAPGLPFHHISKRIQSQIFSGNRKYLVSSTKAAAVYRVSGKVCDSSFMSSCSATVRDRASTRESWGLSNLTKTRTFTLANTGGKVCFCIRNMQQGKSKSALL